MHVVEPEEKELIMSYKLEVSLQIFASLCTCPVAKCPRWAQSTRRGISCWVMPRTAVCTFWRALCSDLRRIFSGTAARASCLVHDCQCRTKSCIYFRNAWDMCGEIDKNSIIHILGITSSLFSLTSRVESGGTFCAAWSACRFSWPCNQELRGSAKLLALPWCHATGPA